MISAITGEEEPKTKEEKRDMLLSHHIALWDVIHSCDIIGSSDKAPLGCTAMTDAILAAI